MPVVSVFVAARAAARWLPDSLQSIARQNLPDGWRLQIRLGIDACEETLAFAKGLSMATLEARYFPHHVGPFVIFNSLARATPSDVLVRFDADDVMLDGYLGQQLQVVADTTKPVITHTWSILVDEQLKPTSAELFNGQRAAADGKRSAPTDGQFLMTRPVMDMVGGFRPWWCHADSDFLLRALAFGCGRYVLPQYLYLRRIHAASLTQSEKTGYHSELRRDYAQQFLAAKARYLKGEPSEYVAPTTSESIVVAAGRD
jgi:hypothetical protein